MRNAPARPRPSAAERPTPLLREVATVARRDTVAGFGAMSLDRRIAPILHNEAARSYLFAGDIYAVYQEMEDKDGHYFAVLQTRKLGILARPQRLQPPPSPNAAARDTVDLVQRALANVADFRQALLGLLDALGKGIAIAEVIWEIAPDGAVLPRALVPRRQSRFRFEEGERLRRVDFQDPPRGIALPERKFLVACFQQQFGDPAGLGLAARVYWYSWFKRNNLKAWALYNEKFGSPTVVARYPQGADEGERRRLLDVIESIQQDAGIAMPEEIELQLLEAGRSGNPETYRMLADWCNDEISKIVLGQTLTTGEGRRTGSLALGRVHDTIRNEYIQADAAMLEEVVNRLVRWIVDFNFGPEAEAPRWRIDTTPASQLGEDLRLDTELIGLGLPLGIDYFYERYGRPRPAGRAAVINYDDRNIFQYHLRFGILTINEVRERMGLGAVAWGDRPAGETGAGAAGEAGALSARGGGATQLEGRSPEEARAREEEEGEAEDEGRRREA